MRVTWKLTVASFKMYFRQREALIWSFLLPLFLIILFSFVRFNGLGSIDVGLVATTHASLQRQSWIDELQKVQTLKITEGERDQEMAELEKGERDVVLVVSSAEPPGGSTEHPSESVVAYVNDGRQQQAQVATLIIQRVLDDIAFKHTPVPDRVVLSTKIVKSRNLTYIDYLIPGIISMSIMQLGIFGVAFGFVSLKKRGIFRRLSVTPIKPHEFIIAQVTMRVVVIMLQIGLMVGVGIFFLHLHFIGNIFLMAVLGLLGGIVFLGMGFAIAGVSKSEDQVAPLANVISLPMLMLSGVFFSRSNLPAILRHITDFIPLTPLADGMRSVAIDGASLTQIGPQILLLAVWGVVACTIAVKMFRWE
ncbi:MAG: ABC transporter permease [Bacteroidota bacterium]